MNRQAIERLLELEQPGSPSATPPVISNENRNPVHRQSTRCMNIFGAPGIIVTAQDGAEYTKRGGQLIRINKNILTKKQRNKDKRLKEMANVNVDNR